MALGKEYKMQANAGPTTPVHMEIANATPLPQYPVFTLDTLKATAEKAGMSKFMFLDKEGGPKANTPYVIGHDFLERLHKELNMPAALEKAAKAVYEQLPATPQGGPQDNPWTNGGNSDMQVLARRLARAALEA